MKAILKVSILACQLFLFQISYSQNEIIETDTSFSTHTLAAFTSTTLLNNCPCNSFDFDREVFIMEKEQSQESYDVLLAKYEKLKYEITLFQKVIQDNTIIPSEEGFTCQNTLNSSFNCGDALIEPLVPHFSNENIVITYFIPKDAKDFKLRISDLDGKYILEYNPADNNYGQITIPAGKLKHGIYNYCLLIEDRKMDCKKMIVMK